MKKVFCSSLIMAFVLLVTSSALAQVKRPEIVKINPGPTIRAMESSVFFVDRLTLTEHGSEFLLQFTITNSSKFPSQGVKFAISGYTKAGNLLARSTWITPDEILSDSKLLSLIDLDPMMRGAATYTAEFTAMSRFGVEGLAEDCTTCTTNAITACGSAGVSSVDCTTTPYHCSYRCKDLIQD